MCTQADRNLFLTSERAGIPPQAKGQLGAGSCKQLHSYLPVDDHVWGALLRVCSFHTAGVSGRLGHVCLLSLGL